MTLEVEDLLILALPQSFARCHIHTFDQQPNTCHFQKVSLKKQRVIPATKFTIAQLKRSRIWNGAWLTNPNSTPFQAPVSSSLQNHREVREHFEQFWGLTS